LGSVLIARTIPLFATRVCIAEGLYIVLYVDVMNVTAYNGRFAGRGSHRITMR
jgi:hypothetical protein